tara:strand:+ start:51 stop:578 length:528 start_codon:yes stop_codon:yes gene_type:complete
MYFANFPIIPYDSVGNGNYKLVTNLLRRVAVRSKVKSNVLFYDTYDVKRGETPEMLADKLYDDPELHWIILLVNDITDRYHQWPLNENQFIAYISDKYSNIDATHHYEISQVSGDTTIKIDIGTDNTGHSGATAVTNFEYEEKRQDELGSIRLLMPGHVPAFVEEYEKLMGESSI